MSFKNARPFPPQKNRILAPAKSPPALLDDHKKELHKQLWNIADTLRGKMNADECWF